MLNSKRHTCFEIWFIIGLSLCLTECEFNPQVESEIDYTGQRGTLVDIDSNVYKTVGIGTQIWMAENLKASRLRDGSDIDYVEGNIDWKLLKQPGYCWYQNDSINNKIYGALYNFFAVETDLLCPAGWHVPKNRDWNILIKYLGGNDVAAGKMKEYHTKIWYGPNDFFDNNYDFSALPGGIRMSYWEPQFEYKNASAYWWTSDILDDIRIYTISLRNGSNHVYSLTRAKEDGLSIRCVKD
jgi:uncharacterized protein (TIGR02145 family)